MSLLKAIVYRIYSSLITFCISFILTKNLLASISIGLFDSLIKIFSYYIFDKIWYKFTRYENKPCVIWLTGLSGAGKTTIAKALQAKYIKHKVYPVVLDGDEIRLAIKQDGFDEESRKKHNKNVGYIASLFEKQGNIVIVSLISPYDDTRDEIRKMCKNFIEVYVSTNLDDCIKRDVKGLYKKALSGEIKDFTGISAPYYPPKNAEITLNTSNLTLEFCVKSIVTFVKKKLK